ncbi:MAG: PTS sugar transporter subunit IIC [Vicinamibacterales bacterium]
MTDASRILNSRPLAALASIGDNAYLSSVRAGMVAIVPLTIVGGLFMIVAFLPVSGWDAKVAPYLPLLQVPVTATFGLLAVVACFSIAWDLGARLGQEPAVSGATALVVFMLLQVDPSTQTVTMDGLGSKGLFTAILVAIVSARTLRFFTDRQLVIRMPPSVPAVVSQSFVSLTPLCFLVLAFWLVRFVLHVDPNALLQAAFAPLVFALNTLPGILAYASLVTILWSIGINGDNAVDAVVAPIFLQYLAANVEATTAGAPLPYVTAYGFFTTFVNVGGTGATIALALLLARSKEPGYRRIARVSLPTQIFQINEPIFFGLPIVMNPVFMIPYVLNALLLTTGTYLLMQWEIVHKPFINVPWTTPPVVGHYLVTGGDWRAAAWGAASIPIAMLVYLPFARAAERQRLSEVADSAGESCRKRAPGQQQATREDK